MYIDTKVYFFRFDHPGTTPWDRKTNVFPHLTLDQFPAKFNMKAESHDAWNKLGVSSFKAVLSYDL